MTTLHFERTLFLFLFFISITKSVSETTTSCFDPTPLTLGERMVGETNAVVVVDDEDDENENGNVVPGCSFVEDLPASWFQIVGTGNRFTASTCDSNTQAFTIVTVLEGGTSSSSSSSCDDLECTFSQEETTRNCQATNLASQVSWTTTEGVVYRLLVSTEVGNTSFGVLVTEQVAAINDQCEGAIPISIDVDVDDTVMIVGSNEFASNDMAQDDCQAFSFSHGVWYSITASASAAASGMPGSGSGSGSFLTATTCTEETTMDTALSILVGDDCDALQCIGINDDQGGDCGETSTLTWPAVAGETYYILVQGFSTMTVGTFGLKVTETLSSSEAPAADGRPRNDECRNAIGPLVPGMIIDEGDDASNKTIVVEGDTANSTSNPSVVEACRRDETNNLDDFYGNRGVWYSLMGTGHIMRVSTCNIFTGTTDTQLTVLLAMAPAADDDGCDHLQCVGGNDNDENVVCLGSLDASGFSWETDFLQRYYVVVHSSDDDDSSSSSSSTGHFGLILEDFFPPSNDECQDAKPLEIDTLTIGSTLDATTDDNVACNSGDINTRTRGVWYSVTGTGGRLLASTCSNSTNFDAQIFVLEGEDDDCSEGFVCKSRSVPDSSCEFGAQVASWISDVNRTYYLLLHSSELSVTGTFGLTVRPFVLPTDAPTTPGPTGRPSPTPGPTPRPITSAPTSGPTPSPVTNFPPFGGTVPGNDSYENAIPITANGSVMLGSTVGATDDKQAVGVNLCGAGIGAPGVWFMVTGTGTGVKVSTCSDATQYDTALSIFTMKADDTTLQCIGGADNNQRCSSRPKSSLVSFFAEAGVSYYVLVHGTNSEVGFFGVSAATFDRVANDVCEAAISISPNEGESLLEGSTWSATIDLASQVFHCGAFVGAKPGVWYRTVGNGASFTATTCSAATDYNTAVSVFGGVCGGFGNTMLRCVGGNDDDYVCAGQFGTSTFTWQTEPDEIYYILVHGSYFADLEDIYLSAIGDFGLLLTAS